MEQGWWSKLGVGGLTMAGCLELNPGFVEEDPSGSGDGSSGESAETMATGADETGAAETGAAETGAAETGADETAGTCEAIVDAFEPNDEGDGADVAAGTLSAVLAPAEDQDWFKTPLDPGGPAEVIARASNPALRVCMFVACDGGETTTVTKCSDTVASDPFGRPGCCGGSTASLEYDCGGTFGIISHVRVDAAATACEAYDLEIGIVGG